MLGFDSTSFAGKGRKIGAKLSQSAGLREPQPFSAAECVEKIFDRPVCSLVGKPIGCGAVLPDTVAQRGGWVGLQLPLRQQTAEITRQHIAAAALREQG